MGRRRRGRALRPAVGVLARLALPLTSRDAPPFGLGLRPRHDRIGRLRDRVARPLTLGSLERIVAAQVNGLRAELGVPPFTTIDASYLAAVADHRLHRRAVRVPAHRLARARSASSDPGSGNRRPTPPPWLDDIKRPLVLVTCSTLFQNDRRLAEVACQAFAGEPVDVVVTTADIDPASLTPPANVRVERFVPHSLVLDHAACVVCHAGMGITQKALAHGVPVVAVPFGRDQPEVARRVEVARAGVRLPARKLTPAAARGCPRRDQLKAGAEQIAAAFAAAGGPSAAADALETLARTPQPSQVSNEKGYRGSDSSSTCYTRKVYSGCWTEIPPRNTGEQCMTVTGR